jgi:hypothetical protein
VLSAPQSAQDTQIHIRTHILFSAEVEDTGRWGWNGLWEARKDRRFSQRTRPSSRQAAFGFVSSQLLPRRGRGAVRIRRLRPHEKRDERSLQRVVWSGWKLAPDFPAGSSMKPIRKDLPDCCRLSARVGQPSQADWCCPRIPNSANWSMPCSCRVEANTEWGQTCDNASNFTSGAKTWRSMPSSASHTCSACRDRSLPNSCCLPRWTWGRGKDTCRLACAHAEFPTCFVWFLAATFLGSCSSQGAGGRVL